MEGSGHIRSRFHKWVVLIAAIMVTWLNFGFIFAFGALYLAILDKFGESRSRTATVHALLMGVTMSFGVVVGFTISKIGLTKPLIVGATLAPLGLIMSTFADSIIALDICIGVVTALGISLIFISSAVALGKVFTGPQRLLALALQNCAISLSGLTYPYVFTWLLSGFGFNGTLLIIGGIFLNTFPAALVLSSAETPNALRIGCCSKTGNLRKPKKTRQETIVIDVPEKYIETHTVDSHYTNSTNGITNDDYQDDQGNQGMEHIQEDQKQQPKETTERETRKGISGLSSLPYLCLVIGIAGTISVLNGYNTVVLDIFKWKGYTEKQGLLSFLPFNISAMLARMLPGVVKQKKGVNSLLLPVLYGCCGCVGQFVILLSETYAVILVGVALTGITIGGVISAGSVAVVNIVGQDKFPVGFGLIQTVTGVMSAASGPLFGAIRDGTDSYWIVLVFTVSMLVMGVASFLACMYIRHRRNRTQEKVDT